jgi:hypothetical protein
MATIYTGSDTYGRDVQLAQREDGVWFFRQYDYNGYGMVWCRWVEWKQEVTYTKSIVNVYDGSVTYFEEGYDGSVDFGFNKLKKFTGANIRLPKPTQFLA